MYSMGNPAVMLYLMHFMVLIRIEYILFILVFVVFINMMHTYTIQVYVINKLIKK